MAMQGETGSAPWCGHGPCPCGLAESHQPRTCRSFCRCCPRGAEQPLRRPRVSCCPLWSLSCEASVPLRSLRLQRGLPSQSLSRHLQCSWPSHKERARSPTNTHFSINTERGAQTALRGKSINTKKSSRVSWDVLAGPAARFAISVPKRTLNRGATSTEVGVALLQRDRDIFRISKTGKKIRKGGCQTKSSFVLLLQARWLWQAVRAVVLSGTGSQAVKHQPSSCWLGKQSSCQAAPLQRGSSIPKPPTGRGDWAMRRRQRPSQGFLSKPCCAVGAVAQSHAMTCALQWPRRLRGSLPFQTSPVHPRTSLHTCLPRRHLYF